MIITTIEIHYIITAPEDKLLIEYIGGTHPNGIRWKISLGRAIRAIENNEWKFHIEIDGQKRNIIITKLRNGQLSLGIEPLHQELSVPITHFFNTTFQNIRNLN